MSVRARASVSIESHKRQLKIVVLVLSTGPSHMMHYQNELAQRETFAVDQGEGLRFLYVRGDPRFAEVNLNNDERVLTVPVVEGLGGVLAKTVLAVDWTLQELKPDLILRSNTSSYFNLTALQRLAAQLPSEGCYAGVVGYHGGRAFASGAGFWMSPDIARLMCEIDQRMFNDVIDDVAIGRHLEEHMIRPIALDRNDVGDFVPLRPCYHSRCKGSRSSKAHERILLLDAVYSASTKDDLRVSLRDFFDFQRRQMWKEKRLGRLLKESSSLGGRLEVVEADFKMFLGLDE